jgi:NMD protein affecting ribosome stability and mRNA decay
MSRSQNAVPFGDARRNIHDNDDPYRLAGALAEGTICSECGAVFHGGRWTLNDELRRKLEKARAQEHARQAHPMNHSTLCPGCRKAQDHCPGGVVTLRGDYLTRHHDEIMALVRNEEKKAVGVNPTERIIQVLEQNGDVVIETTNEKLAQRLGRAVHRACHGDIQYKWSEDNKLARVEWRRDQ